MADRARVGQDLHQQPSATTTSFVVDVVRRDAVERDAATSRRFGRFGVTQDQEVGIATLLRSTHAASTSG